MEGERGGAAREKVESHFSSSCLAPIAIRHTTEGEREEREVEGATATAIQGASAVLARAAVAEEAVLASAKN